MSKKEIIIKYFEPIEFVLFYLQDDYDSELTSLEKHTKMSILEILKLLGSKDDLKISNILTKPFEKFAPEVGYSYCKFQSIFHEYSECPFCAIEGISDELGLIID